MRTTMAAPSVAEAKRAGETQASAERVKELSQGVEVAETFKGQRHVGPAHETALHCSGDGTAPDDEQTAGRGCRVGPQRR